ncbi:hypothetical protein HID58_090767 [Brassica napus]|uniref:F-box domain-containing protein n=1 Tax=Brassica napus TaxID=3708 RepID=A0ABQ7XAJ3_BRANA|nr:hypothetical protein HID58_090767 [Brassica napus]
MNNLSKDLLEDILSRVPKTSLIKLRSTCKKWNTLSKDETFTKKHLLNHHQEQVKVYHCEGLLLCVTEDYTRLVLWNPYTGEARWISVDHSKYAHALGFEEGNSCRAVLDVTPDWKMEVDGESNSNNYGVSLKGNVYWFAQDKEAGGNVPVFYSVLISQQRGLLRVCLCHGGRVTTKIEPDGVSWSKFLAVDMSPLTWFQFFSGGSFLLMRRGES